MSLLLAVSVIASTVFFSSGTSSDEILNRATQITYELFSQDLEQGEKLEGYIHSSYLKGLDGEKDFILSQCTGGGYAIYEKEGMEIIEYSDTEKSPYNNVLIENRYYAGPTNYFEAEEDKVKNIKSGKVFERNKIEDISKKLKEKIEIDRNKRKDSFHVAEKDNAMKDALVEINDLNPGPTGDDTIDADSYIVKERKYISNYQYFLGNHGHGHNFDGTCVSVATQLLLGYNNWARDGRLIPHSTSNEEELFWDRNWTEDSRLSPYSDVMRATNSSDIRNDSEISFYEKLKEYINPYARSFDERTTKEESPFNNGATLNDAKNGINSYIKKYAPARLGEVTIETYEPLILTQDKIDTINDKIKDEIDNNRPVMVSIYLFEENEDETYSKSGHAIIVYGYQEIEYEGQEINGFIAHFGWGISSTHIWFNSSWVKGYLTFRMAHTHDIGSALDPKNHIFACGICGGVFIKGSHDSNTVVVLDENDNQYDNNHMAICSCEYIYNERHNFIYSARSSIEHRKYCECGYSISEEHFYKNGDMCFYCAYSNN